MTRSFLVSIFLLCAPAFASETDMVTDRKKAESLPSASYILNSKMNEVLSEAASGAKGCDVTSLHAGLMAKLGGFVVAQIELWPQEEENKIPFVRTPLEKSIYADSLRMKLGEMLVDGCCAEVMRVGDSLISSDKLGHFFQQGFERFYAIRLHSMKPLADPRDFWSKLNGFVRGESQVEDGGELERSLKDLNWTPGKKLTEDELKKYGEKIILGISNKMESGSFGGDWGIKSYGDMAADLEGYRFWSSLTEGDHPYFRCVSGKWKQTRDFRWEEYVSDSWDEGINCSEYSLGMEKVVSQALKKAGKSCPANQEKCVALTKRYRGLSNPPLSPACQALGGDPAKDVSLPSGFRLPSN